MPEVGLRFEVQLKGKMNLIFQDRYQRLFGFLLLVALFILSWKLQDQLYLNYDVSWLLLAVNRMLEGGSYSQDFFETNPPLILYLYLPPVILSKALPVKLAVLFRSYLFLLVSGSLGACYFLLEKLFKNDTSLFSLLFFLLLASVELVLPCYDFGQREHLLVLLTLPYFLLLACQLQKETISPVVALVLGLAAGLGFAIKPHFLMVLMLSEGYAVLFKKDKWAWLRPEVLAILGVLLAYGLLIFFFYPDYLYIVVPYSWRLYYRAVSDPWSKLLLNSIAVYCWFPVFVYLAQYKEKSNKPLRNILLLALLGFLLSYYAQRMIHYYHLIPALSFALLLLLVELSYLWRQYPKRGSGHVFVLILAALLFSIPVWFFHDLYSKSLAYKHEMLSKLAAFMNEHAKGAPVYFFVTAGSYAFPTVDYTSSSVAPRFYFLWMAAGLANQAPFLLQKRGSSDAEQYLRDKNFLINMIADDLYRYKPRYIFVDQSSKKYRIKDEHFDYLSFFFDNPKFRQQWGNYRYFTTIETGGSGKLGVYVRRAGEVAFNEGAIT